MADEQKEKKEDQKEKDPRRRILLVSILVEVGIFVGINLLFLLPSIVSMTTLQTISLVPPSSGKILTGAILGIVGMIVGFAIFKKGLWRRIFLILVLIGTFVVIGSSSLPTISVAALSSWAILTREIVRTVVMVVVGFLLIYWWWAPNNLFFTFGREGTYKIIVMGHEFYKALIQLKGYTFDNPKTTVNVVPINTWVKDGRVLDVVEVINRRKGRLEVREKGATREITGAKKYKKEWHPFGGLRLYAFPWPWPILDVFTYWFQWTGVKDDGKLEPHPSEPLDFIIAKDDIYACKVTEAEDKEMMPLELELLITAMIVNPYKALFVIENWYETMINRIRTYVRDFITTKTYSALIKKQARVGIEIMEKLEEQGILEELRDRYGIEIRKIEVNDINPKEQFREITMKKVIAKREKEAIIIKAEAEKVRLTTVAKGETGRIDAIYSVIKKFGSLGELVRTLEAMERSPEKGAKWIIPLPGMSELLSTVFPGRAQLTPDDIKGLREMLQKTVQGTNRQAS